MAHKGEALKAIVDRANTTIQDIADKCNVSRRTIYLWFNNPDLDDATAERVGNAINVNIYEAAPNIFGLKTPVPLPKRANAPVDKETSDFWKDKYIAALEENNRLKDRISELEVKLSRQKEVAH